MKKEMQTYKSEAGKVETSLLGLSGHVSLQVVLFGLDCSESLSVSEKGINEVRIYSMLVDVLDTIKQSA